MKARINTYVLRRTCFESASLGVLDSIVHPVNLEGDTELVGTVIRGKIVIAEFLLTVSPDVESLQVSIDLSKLADSGARAGRATEHHFRVNANGYVQFYASNGPGGFAVELARFEEKQRKIIFDSRKLEKDNLYAVTLIRPGHYVMTNAVSKEAEGIILVSYPEPSRSPQRQREPVRIACRAQGFDPERTEVDPGQGVVFQIETPSVIKVRLHEADDGPGGKVKLGIHRPSPRTSR